MSIVDKILVLKKEINALILAHNYQIPEVQDIADYVGDSLELSIKAMLSDKRVVVFAGVDFMAEQASVLSPDKVILHPEPGAKCPMAAMITPEDLKKARSKYSNAPVVVYVNSPAVVKAYADYVVTSSSAVKLVSQLDSDTVLFGPDRNLADYLTRVTGKQVIPVPQNSYCPVHESIREIHVKLLREKYPSAKLVAHPECLREVRDLSDFIGSTSQMVKYVKETSFREYLIATEIGLIHRLVKENPGKIILPVYDKAICEDMKKINLEKILYSMLNKTNVVKVSEDISHRVMRVLENSFELIGVETPWRRK